LLLAIKGYDMNGIFIEKSRVKTILNCFDLRTLERAGTNLT